MIGMAFTSSSVSAVDSSVAGLEMGRVGVESPKLFLAWPRSPSTAQHVTIVDIGLDFPTTESRD